jgi:LysM repeat protein
VVESDSPSGGLEAGSPSAHPPHESEMITPEAGGSNIILLEGAKPSVPTNPCRDTQPTGRYYTVQPNDCLFRIGLAYDLRWTAIARANGLRAPYRIYAGQTLLIPGQ